MKQNSLFPSIVPDKDLAIKDTRPAPLIVSEQWDFPLTYIDQDGNNDNYLYCARDWYMGLGGDKGNWAKAKNDWLYKDNQLNAETKLIETKRERRAPEMLEYVTEKGLYDITQNMRVVKSNEARLKPIKDFMSIAARGFDAMRRGSKRGKKLIKTVSEIRHDGIEKRKAFTKVAQETHVTGKPRYDILTNAIYHKIGRTVTEQYAAREIASFLGLSDKEAKHMRDFFNPLLDSAVAMTEEASKLTMLNYGRKLTTDEQINITRQNARAVAATAWELAKIAGVDLVTNQKLLPSGK